MLAKVPSGSIVTSRDEREIAQGVTGQLRDVRPVVIVQEILGARPQYFGPPDLVAYTKNIGETQLKKHIWVPVTLQFAGSERSALGI